MATKALNASGKPLYALYGGNTGSCEGFAQKLAEIASSQGITKQLLLRELTDDFEGFDAHVLSLDSLPNPLPKDGPLIIFTASFEGEIPPECCGTNLII